MQEKQYYGLRLMSFVYQTLAVVIAIFSIASVGLLWADQYLNGGDLLLNGAPWVVRAFMTLGIGGLIALTCYVLSQLIDAQLETLKNTQLVMKQLGMLKQIQATQADMLRAIHNLSPESAQDMPRVRHQLAERSRKLQASED